MFAVRDMRAEGTAFSFEKRHSGTLAGRVFSQISYLGRMPVRTAERKLLLRYKYGSMLIASHHRMPAECQGKRERRRRRFVVLILCTHIHSNKRSDKHRCPRRGAVLWQTYRKRKIPKMSCIWWAEKLGGRTGSLSVCVCTSSLRGIIRPKKKKKNRFIFCVQPRRKRTIKRRYRRRQRHWPRARRHLN